MRVIAGERRGFRLKGPAGRFTRPMADKIKGALFSMLDALGAAPLRVLDLYAGTGSLGIEALSRSAEWADFVEQNAAAAAVVRGNLAHTRYSDVTRVYQEPVATFLARAERNPAAIQPYDLIVMDPPYADGAAVALAALPRARLTDDAVIAVEHAHRAPPPERVGFLVRTSLRRYGDTELSLYRIEIERPHDAP